MSTERPIIEFELNGAPARYEGPPLARLLDVLRVEMDRIAAKEGCGEGECGACTVLLDGDPVCSCLVPMLQLAGRTVVTAEGLTDHPLHHAFVAEGGVQCGACTPGIVVTARALLAREPAPSRDRVRELLAGNLCRCTGYEGIFRSVEAAVAAAADGVEA